MKNYILALDQGTTGTRAFLFDARGKVVAGDYKEFKQYYPRPGWVEHDADEIWETVQSVIQGVLHRSKISKHRIAAIGITNQRETTVMWDRKTSRPVARAIVWQCRRTADICRQLKSYENYFREKTGLVLDAYFSGTKIKWYMDHIKGLRVKAQKGSVCFGTIDSWLIWKLTGGQSHVTDMTNASRTLVFNIQNLKWDSRLLKILNIPPGILPRVQHSGSDFGETAVKATVLPAGIPILAVLGDQQAALYGQGCFEPGTVKNTYGTGCFLVLNTGKKFLKSSKGLLTTLASDESGNPVYALEGSIFIGGAVMQWLRDELKLIKTAQESEKIIKGLTDTNGAYVVPAFVGLGAPYWDSRARGIICGLTRGVNQAHIVRAALESIAYQTKDVFDVMQMELGKKIRELKVDGGASHNNFLMQFQADVLGVPVLRPAITETTALGAAGLAGLAVGLWEGEKALNRVWKVGQSLYLDWVEPMRKARLFRLK
jgi:glycerol kinase